MTLIVTIAGQFVGVRMTGVGEYKKQIGEEIKCILGALFLCM